MPSSSFTIDSNILIYHLNRDDQVTEVLERWLVEEEHLFISSITRIEVLSAPSIQEEEEKEIEEFEEQLRKEQEEEDRIDQERKLELQEIEQREIERQETELREIELRVRKYGKPSQIDCYVIGQRPVFWR